MKIAVIGIGHVGGTLARLWAGCGHEVTAGVRDAGLKTPPRGLKTTGVAEACGPADVVALCVPWNAVNNAIEQMGPLAGKIVIDTTNPLLPDMSGLTIGTTTSAAEQIASQIPEAKVVKAFNGIGSYLLGDADFGFLRADGYYCGDDSAAKGVVGRLIEDAGLEPVDTGPLNAARILEPLALLWIYLLFRQGRPRDFAFKLLHREPGS